MEGWQFCFHILSLYSQLRYSEERNSSEMGGHHSKMDVMLLLSPCNSTTDVQLPYKAWDHEAKLECVPGVYRR